jgi:hypothetical protein
MQVVGKQVEIMWVEVPKLLLDSSQCHPLSNKKEKYQLEIEELF